MKQHKYSSLLSFVHLDGVKEFKETDPSLFSEDGISTSTIQVDTGENAPVTMHDAKRACELFIKGEINQRQLQQWAEWIHSMDFFDLIPDGEAPENDETLIDVLSDLDNIDLLDTDEVTVEVNRILEVINSWIMKH